MASLKAPQPRRGHGRSASDDRRHAAILTASTKGPLEDVPENPSSLQAASSPARSRSISPLPPGQRSSAPGVDQMRQTIVALVCRPEIYRPLPPNMIPQAFLASATAATADASVEDLVQNGQFYAAAITSARQLSDLSTSSSTKLETVFDLLYTRLACLSIINRACLEIAAIESLELRDLTAAMYLHPVTNEHVVPWHLRILAVRLQSIGYKDWRRGVMAFYVLAHDARLGVAKARSEKNTNSETLWASRLHDVSIRVANVLVEMGDLDAANRHLRTLDSQGISEASRKRLLVMQILVWLQVGDLRATKRCLATLHGSSDSIMSPTLNTIEATGSEDYSSRVLLALANMAEGNFPAAALEWEQLEKSHEDDDMISQNLAICLLYTGRLVEAHEILENAVDESSAAPFHSLLFNLSTFYELSSDKARENKTKLTERVAQITPSSSGWQRSTTDFKMESIRT